MDELHDSSMTISDNTMHNNTIALFNVFMLNVLSVKEKNSQNVETFRLSSWQRKMERLKGLDLLRILNYSLSGFVYFLSVVPLSFG